MIDIQVQFLPHAKATLRGYKMYAPEANMQSCYSVPICSLLPPKRDSEGFRIPLDDWMLEEYSAFDVSYITCSGSPTIKAYMMEAPIEAQCPASEPRDGTIRPDGIGR